MYKALYQQYRPAFFSDFIGQTPIVGALKDSNLAGRTTHAYLFTGPRGTGKTSMARVFTKALNCLDLEIDGEPCGKCQECESISIGNSLSVHELDAASNSGVDAIRDLIEKVALSASSKHKVYIIDEVHMLTPQASNALLKTLEEPPSKVIFILCTTQVSKVLSTICSRTQIYRFSLVKDSVLKAYIKKIIKEQELDCEEEIDEIVKEARGSVRDALSCLERVAQGGQGQENLDEFIDTLLKGEPRAVELVGQLLETIEPRRLCDGTIEILREVFFAELKLTTNRLPKIVRAIERFGIAIAQLSGASDQRLILEIAVVNIIYPQTDATLSGLSFKLDKILRLLEK